ncbi:MAG TPA: glycosyltransferase [Chitinophagaceae bacterium]|nr:glycosyltransferase [Chitinophagaceae bacterium]
MNWTLLKDHLWEIVFYLFCLVTFIQFFYYIFFFSRVAFYKANTKNQSQQHPVSVIICARDEDENIARYLPGVLVQKYSSSHEIIVVNDNSVDDSKYILEELQKTFKLLQIVDLKQEAKLISGKKYPLSIGIKEARHEIVLLTDADCVPASELWIQKMQDGYVNGTEIVIGYGAYNKRPGFLNKIIRFETFHSALQYLSFALAGKPYMGVGRNLSYKKDVFIRNKGFSSINHIPGGDDDLFINKVATKKNTKIVIDKDAITLSQPKRSFSEWIRQKTRHYSTARYYKKGNKFLLAIYSVSQFFFYPLFLLSILFYNWQFALAVFGARFLLQSFVFFKAMKKLNEADLWPWFLFFDIGMFFYYIIFAPTLWKKPRVSWN